MLLQNKCVLVQERSGYPRNETSMGVSVSLLAHLAMKHVLQVITSLKFILLVSCDAMPPYGGSGC